MKVTTKCLSYAAYGASVWSFLFAAVSFYWALGGAAGLETISPSVTDMAQSTWFVILLWGTAILKVLGGLLALSLVRPWGAALPRPILLFAAWGAGILLTLYAGVNLAVRGLMAVGVMNTPDSMHSAAARWHLILWEPWWLIGGILFIVAARGFSNATKNKGG